MSKFEVRAHWKGALDGNGKITAPGLESSFSVSKDLNGSGIGTNPEELMLAAAAGCFLITTAAVLKRLNVPVSQLNITSELEMEVGQALKIKKIIHRPEVVLLGKKTGSTEEVVRRGLSTAEQYCLISKAVQGNVSVEVSAVISEGNGQ